MRARARACTRLPREIESIFGVASHERIRLNGRLTKNLKIWDKRVPIVQSGPWFKPNRNRKPVNGFHMDQAFPSEYVKEIKIFR